MTLRDWLTQDARPKREIAEALGVSTVSLWRIAEGKQTPSLALAARLQALTGIPAASFAPAVKAAA